MNDLIVEVKEGVFTKKETLVMKHLAKGEMRLAIAHALCRSVKTISRHIESIERKLGAHNQTEAVAISVAKGFVKITTSSLIVCIALNLFNSDFDIQRAGRGRVRTELRIGRDI